MEEAGRAYVGVGIRKESEITTCPLTSSGNTEKAHLNIYIFLNMQVTSPQEALLLELEASVGQE